MPECRWREKPGSAEVCGMLADVGSEYCPRHKFLAGVKEAKGLEKERAALVKRKALAGVRPNNRRALLEQGYQFTGNGICRACSAPIEWFRTKNGNNSPYDSMPDLDSPARSHFATCTRANDFRRSA